MKRVIVNLGYTYIEVPAAVVPLLIGARVMERDYQKEISSEMIYWPSDKQQIEVNLVEDTQIYAENPIGEEVK